MDFFSIFQNKEDIVDIKKVKKRNNTSKPLQKTSKGAFTDDVDRLQGAFTDDVDIKQQDDSIKNDIYNTTLYKNIRKGNFVKIIGVNGSYLNTYKGYTGEIKDYKRDQDFAIIFLHAVNQITIVKFPINHFIIID